MLSLPEQVPGSVDIRAVIVVPWRGGDANREENWAVTAPYLNDLGFPIYLGDRQGPWSRGAAINAGAREAGSWDVMVIADADTIPEVAPIHKAVEIATATNGAIRPHNTLWMMNPVETLKFIAGGPGSVKRSKRSLVNLGGGLLVVSREAWDRVGGYDESFVGWGHEDTHLNTRLLLEAHWDRIPGKAWHLFHPRDDGKTEQRFRNKRKAMVLQMQHEDAIAAEGARRGWDIGAVL